MATPVTEVINHLVEGDIVREKTNPIMSGGYYNINKTTVDGSSLQKRALKILCLYKNGNPIVNFTASSNDGWAKVSDSTAYGNERLVAVSSLFDSTAEYTVTYIADKEKYTVNPVSVPVSWEGSFKSAFNDVVATVSVNVKSIIELYVKIKGLGV